MDFEKFGGKPTFFFAMVKAQTGAGEGFINKEGVISAAHVHGNIGRMEYWMSIPLFHHSILPLPLICT
jgi:hypothetical protein